MFKNFAYNQIRIISRWTDEIVKEGKKCGSSRQEGAGRGRRWPCDDSSRGAALTDSRALSET